MGQTLTPPLPPGFTEPNRKDPALPAGFSEVPLPPGFVEQARPAAEAHPYDIREHPEDYNKMTTAQKVLMAPAMIQRPLQEGLKGLVTGPLDFLARLDEAPIPTMYDFAKNLPGVFYKPLQKEYTGRKSGDTAKMLEGATEFVTQTLPMAFGAKSFFENPAAAVRGMAETAAGMPNRAAMMRTTPAEAARSWQELSTVISRGIKQGTGLEAAEISQPYLQSFAKRTGLSPRDILPDKGDAVTLNRGGSAQALARINETLQSDWVASGKTAESFVPHKDIHMALADGAVNEAHAPIANAVRAVRGVRIDGSEPGVPNIQKQVIDALRARQDALSPSQHTELDQNFNKAIADVQVKGGTIGGLDSIRQDWNSGMTRFHSGNPTAITNADASSAAVWNDGNAIIRKNLYPALESLTDRPGATSNLKVAGQKEAVVIQARDGIYEGRIRSSNMGDNVAVQKYLNYITQGPSLIVRGVSGPMSTAVSLGSRLLGKEIPMGEFNAALRRGLGDFTNVTPMNPAALPKKQLTTGTDTSGPIPFRPGQIQNRLMAPTPPPDASGIIPLRPGQIQNRLAPLPDASGPIPMKVQDIVAAEPKMLGGAVLPRPDIAPAPFNFAPRPESGGIMSGGVSLPLPTTPPSGGYEFKVTTGEPLKQPAPPKAAAETVAKPKTETKVAKPAPPKPKTETKTAAPAVEKKTAPVKTEAKPAKATGKDFMAEVAKDEAKAKAQPAKKAAPVKVEAKAPTPPVKKAETPPAPAKAAPVKMSANEVLGAIDELHARRTELAKAYTEAADPKAKTFLEEEIQRTTSRINQLADELPAATGKPAAKATAPTPPPTKTEPAPAVKVKPADDIETLKARVQALEKETEIKLVVKTEAKPAAAPKKAAAPTPPTRNVATSPAMDVLRKRGVVTVDDLVNMASSGDKHAGTVLAKADKGTINPNDSEALTNAYLNEFDSVDLPGDIKDLHARIGRRFAKGGK